MRDLQSSSSEEEEVEEDEEGDDDSGMAPAPGKASRGDCVQIDENEHDQGLDCKEEISSEEGDEIPVTTRRVHQRDIRRHKKRLLQQQMEEKERQESNAKEQQDDEAKAKEKEDLDYLDSVLEEQGISPEAVKASLQQNLLRMDKGGGSIEACQSNSSSDKLATNVWELLSVDHRGLDVDAVLRKRFGSSIAAMFNNAVNNRGVNQHGHRGRLANIINNNMRQQQRYQISRKVIFGNPKPEWPQRPPSYVSGGMRLSVVPSPTLAVATFTPSSSPVMVNQNGLVVAEDHASSLSSSSLSSSSSTSRYSNLYLSPQNICFQFEWSVEYKELQSRYNQIINSGNANLLVVFISQHPYHIDGLLQLALIFAKIGHMDRSSDLVRRSLYYLECACTEKFKVRTVLIMLYLIYNLCALSLFNLIYPLT